MVEPWLSKLLKERGQGPQLLVDTSESSSQGPEDDLVVVAEVEVIRAVDLEDTMIGLVGDMMIGELETIKDREPETTKIDIIEIGKEIDITTDVIDTGTTIEETKDREVGVNH